MQTKGWEIDRSSLRWERIHSKGDFLNCRRRLGVLGGECLVRSRRFGSKTWNSELGSGKEGTRGWQSWSGKLRD